MVSIMLLYSKTFENVKTLNCNFPIEDQYYVTDNQAIVADGITRDPIGIYDFTNYSFDDMKEKYPRPSGAALAATEICKAFANTTSGTMKEKLIIANNMVKKLNDKYIKRCDYLQNDYFGAVAACIHIENDILNYAYICDCGVIVYDKMGNIKFQTEDDKKLYCDPFMNVNKSWADPEGRIIVRRDFRNNPNKTLNGKCISYGAITGEKEATFFIKEGSLKLAQNDFILLYSDGFSNFLHNKEFIKQIINFNKDDLENFINDYSCSNYEKYGKEKTLILFKN